MSGDTRRMLSLKPPGMRLEVQVHRLLGDQQVRVDRRQVAQLDRVVAAHRVAALEPLVAHQVRQAVGQHVEVHAAVVVVEEERVVERGRLAGVASGTPRRRSEPCRIR